LTIKIKTTIYFYFLCSNIVPIALRKMLSLFKLINKLYTVIMHFLPAPAVSTSYPWHKTILHLKTLTDGKNSC